jgi:hypothetical protein
MFVLKVTRGLILRLFIASFLMIFTFSSFAMEAGPKDVDKMVNTLVSSGMIKKSDGEALRKKMKGMSADQWKQVNDMAKKMQSNPEMMKKMMGGK